MTSPWRPVEPSSVATFRSASQRGSRSGGVARRAEALAARPRHSGSRADRHRSGATPIPPPTSRGPCVALVRGLRNPNPQRAHETEDPRPRSWRPNRAVPGPYVLEQEVEIGVPFRPPAAARAKENARGR